MRPYKFVLADVFTDRIFGGNQLAVLTDARGISDGDMQRIAREFNLSETVFVLAPENPAHTRRLRIFTPAKELPFAGHPTVGTAVVLAETGALGSHTHIVLEETVGPVAVRIARADGELFRATLSSPRMPERGPAAPGRTSLAAVLGLADWQLEVDGFAAAAYSAGLPFTFIPVRDAAALSGVQIDTAAWRAALAGTWAPLMYVFTIDGWPRGRRIRARMFAPGLGIPEDPATGAAAAAFAGYLTEYQRPGDGLVRWEIRQGEDMGRPSLIELEADVAAGRATAVRVGGCAVIIGYGELLIPGQSSPA
jgi:trans-2,3-dihydro-3-hydroxyanthranilate isomerase